MQKLIHTVLPTEAGRTIKDILMRAEKVSTTSLKSAKWEGAILLNGDRRNVTERVQHGDVITMLWPDAIPSYAPAPYDLPLTVSYRDEHLMVIDKPAPLPSLSGSDHDGQTLENAVFSYFHCPDSFIYRPVNRLDKGTSGLMAVALDSHTQQLMQAALHTDSFLREYLAVVEGEPPALSGTIDLPIGKEKAASIKRVIAEEGKPSVTHYEVLERKNGRALVRLRLETGRTHQIRVHMSAVGCPVCGDFLYGTELPELPGRFALHSAFLTLTHPLTGEVLRLTSPLPEALRLLLVQPRTEDR